ncbi:MAG: hypothetical protein EAZ16_00595 [Sphingobacteriales bacterium]|nr:MAG: hypothetical protein EAZ16_00595 [Sphingobacteriales bacterium]
MKNTYHVIFFCLGLLLVTLGCRRSAFKNTDPCITQQTITDKSSQTQDSIFLSNLFKEIYDISGAANCQPADQWKVAPIGTKPCGGPVAYLPYKATIDETCLLKKIAFYTQQTQLFNNKYSIISDCAVVPYPTTVACENGKAVVKN